MIEFTNVSKMYPTGLTQKWTLRDASFRIERGEAIGICGINGAGKSTLLRMMSGIEHPTSGRIRRTFSISWPLGFSHAFQSSLTGADNTRFIARIYGIPWRRMVEEVEAFADLGPFMRMPVKTYSSGMKARLAFAVSLAVNFDCYLVDEITAVGDASFQARCHQALWARRSRGTLVMVSHSVETLREFCTRGATLVDGVLTFYDTIDEALAAYCDAHGIGTAPPPVAADATVGDAVEAAPEAPGA
ncbi:MAG TPA: ABC transporter ATP-binding protein [Caulobacteraceae bacterium]|jgi:capsular polysaccharide transport system ATP-binding protein|nr:ABC transporter ATP-binding protein [Caulobacteraceae bacterium]